MGEIEFDRDRQRFVMKWTGRHSLSVHMFGAGSTTESIRIGTGGFLVDGTAVFYESFDEAVEAACNRVRTRVAQNGVVRLYVGRAQDWMREHAIQEVTA